MLHTVTLRCLCIIRTLWGFRGGIQTLSWMRWLPSASQACVMRDWSDVNPPRPIVIRSGSAGTRYAPYTPVLLCRAKTQYLLSCKWADTAFLLCMAVYPANTRRWTNAGLMLVQRLRRWSSIKPALVQRLVCWGPTREPKQSPIIQEAKQIHKKNVMLPRHIMLQRYIIILSVLLFED